MTIIAAADGSALGNPGPAGWAWYVDDDHWDSGGWEHGTNNMGELTAVLELLQATAGIDDDLHVYCDSTYAINTVTKWMAGWKRRGWKKGDGKPVQNLAIVQALDAAMAGRRVHFEWVKGHTGHVLNEHADRLASAAATAFRDGHAPIAGPGFPAATRCVSGPDSAETHRGVAGASSVPAEPDLFSELEVSQDLPTEHEVVRLERALLTDDVRRDATRVAELLHPDWSEIGSSGLHGDRAGTLARIGPLDPQPSLEVIELSEVGPDTMLLLWRSSDETGTRLRSSLWVRHHGRWVMRFHQGTVES